jgi:ATP-dependent DNA ligase
MARRSPAATTGSRASIASGTGATTGGVFLYAFDLMELGATRSRCARRRSSVLARAAPGLRFNEHLDEEDGPIVFAHTCKLGLEGIVSKRKDSRYGSGRSPDWIKRQELERANSAAGMRDVKSSPT